MARSCLWIGLAALAGCSPEVTGTGMDLRMAGGGDMSRMAQPDLSTMALPDLLMPDLLMPDLSMPPKEIDLHNVMLFDNPPDLANWPVTTTITDVEFQLQGDGIYLEFSKKDGPSRWPDVTPPGWMGPLEYTVGLVEYIDGQWYGSAAIEYWYGLPSSGGNVASDVNTKQQCTSFGHNSTCQIAKNWYYDGRWGGLAGYQPATGELIGVFVAAGNLRGVTTDDPNQSPVMERSNVVLLPMPDFAGGKYTF